ncbi:hypothetical protein QN277_004672 [Acacia crassicarpa]|uniref:BZIP domain-containing protein n=1 Tax=Acacia crassicarpa TaxID=499986 RepID=A0AAE1MH12_9FABA|nr:hypothetical protein QN277_004672 [Acacia crassicarpa]
MEEFWKDINRVPLITATTHSVPCSSSSSASPPSPASASKLHEFFTQPLRITSDTNPSLVTSSASLFPNSASSLSKKLSECAGDRRSKRMIKNRESAARSRARKQAYTNELEQKLALLREENAELTRQLEQVDEASATNKHKLKRPPYRTLTAPF